MDLKYIIIILYILYDLTYFLSHLKHLSVTVGKKTSLHKRHTCISFMMVAYCSTSIIPHSYMFTLITSCFVNYFAKSKSTLYRI